MIADLNMSVKRNNPARCVDANEPCYGITLTKQKKNKEMQDEC